MENFLLCSRILYDKDLLDKTKEIENLKKERREAWGDYYKLENIFLEHYYCSDRDKIHYCNHCSTWLCRHVISEETENMAKCGLCDTVCVYLNAEEQEIDGSFEVSWTIWFKERKQCPMCGEIKEKLAPIYELVGLGVEGWCLHCILEHIINNMPRWLERESLDFAFNKWKHT